LDHIEEVRLCLSCLDAIQIWRTHNLNTILSNASMRNLELEIAKLSTPQDRPLAEVAHHTERADIESASCDQENNDWGVHSQPT
jgi:hypothetical protein